MDTYIYMYKAMKYSTIRIKDVVLPNVHIWVGLVHVVACC